MRPLAVSCLLAAAIAPNLLAGAPPVAPVVHRLAADASGIFANAYVVETARGLVVIDGRLLTSDGQAVRAKLDALGKPLLAVLVTHGHPDHYNGITEIVSGADVPIVATAGVAEVIRKDDAAKEAQWSATFGAEWPKKRTFPDRVVKDGDSLAVGGLTFKVHDLGPGESHSDSYWTTELDGRRVAFIGDAVLHGMHAYVADGHTSRWLANLDRLRRELADAATLYPGHGDPGGLEMLDWQKNYLTHYRAAVKELAGGEARLSEAQKKDLVARMKRVLPDDRLEFLVPLGADAVAAELAAEPRDRR